MKKDKSIYVRHIYDCLARIKEYVQDGMEVFLKDRKTQDAVVRNLEVIGQAVKDIGVEVLAARPPAFRGGKWREHETFWRTTISASI